MAETILLDIPTDQIEAAIKAIARARAEVAGLKEQQKELDQSSEAYTKNAIRLKELNGTIRENERVVMANTKAQKANQGSIEQLRAQLAQATQQWNKLSAEERDSTEAGKALSKNKLDLTNRLKELEKATGDTRRNVGNYSEGVKEALKETGAFSREVQVIQKVTNIYNTTLNSITETYNRYTQVNVAATVNTAKASSATNVFSKALRVLKFALISTGIGAIVVALGALAAGFFSTQKGSDTLSRALKPLQFIFSRLLGVLQDVTDALLNLDFKRVWDQIRGLGSTVAQAAKDGYAFANATIAMEEAEIKLAESAGKLNRTFEEQKSIVQDITKTQEERQAAADAAMKALTELSALEEAVIQKQIEAKKLQIAQNDTDREAKLELVQLESQLEEIVVRRLTKEREVRNQLNSINKQAEDQRRAQVEAAKKQREEDEKERIKALEEQQKAAEEEIKRQEQLRQQALESELEFAKRQAQEEINILNQKLLANEISVEAHNKRLEQMRIQALEAERAIVEAFGEDVMDIDTQITEAKVASLKAQLDASTIAAETEKKQKEDVLKTAISTAGEQTVVGKILSSAQAAINTYEAASLAIATIPPPLGAIQAALVTIQGLAQVAKINAIQVPKFATGIIGVDGPGTGTSDSISAKISAGESVVTAKATAAFAPMLAAMERAVGNNPNIGKVGRAKFANGVINMGVNATRQAAQLDGMRQRRQAEELAKQPIYVSVVELEDVQGRYNRARSVSVVE